MRATTIRLIGCALAVATRVSAHDYWMLPAAAFPDTGARVTFHVCSGHTFPRSETLLGERVLYRVEKEGPHERTPLKPRPEEHHHAVDAVFEAPGVYRVGFMLKRPRDTEPSVYARTLVITGGEDDPSAYATGDGLEIVPLTRLSAWAPGDALPVEVRWQGEVTEASIRVIREDRRIRRIRAAPNRPALLRGLSPGALLLSAERGGVTGTLTVILPEAGP